MGFFLTPRIGDGLTPQTAFRPKYCNTGDLGAGNDLVGWSAWNITHTDFFVVRVTLSAAQRTALQGMSDTRVVPANLDSTIGGALANVQNVLEAINLPADWLTSGHTWREFLQGLSKLVRFRQRFWGLASDKLFEAGVTLSTTLNQLTAAQRQKFADVAASFGVTSADVTPSMTIREVLILLAFRLPDVVLE